MALGGAVSLADTPQTKTATTAAAVTPLTDKGFQRNITDKDYVIGVDDVIAIVAIGHEDVSAHMSVLPDGTISVAGIPGVIHAEGLTVNQLNKIIDTGLSKIYNNLNLSVSVAESHSRFATIIGAKASGQYPLHKDEHVSELIANAGGAPVVKIKYLRGVLIRDYKRIPLDMLKILEAKSADPIANPLVQPHDTVIIDTLDEAPPPSFSVIGAVAKQGTYALPLDGSAFTLTQAIAMGGGQVDQAALSRVSLLRNGQHIGLNLYKLLIQGDPNCPEAKMTMADGDVLLFPATQQKYMVLGQVNKPASFPLPETEKITVLRALSEAGGGAEGSDLRKAGIVRTVDGKPTWLPINLDRMIKHPADDKNKTGAGMVMQDGDVLYVPPKGKAWTMSDIVSPFYVLTSLGLRPFL